MATKGIVDHAMIQDSTVQPPSQPAELRPLIEFLEYDRRPAFILERHHTALYHNRERRIVYSNSACELPAEHEQDWKELLEDLIEARVYLADGRRERVAVFNGSKWDVRHVGDGWTVLVGRDDDTGPVAQPSSASDTESEGLSDSPPTIPAENGITHVLSNDGERRPSANAMHAPLDWTKHDVPGVSSWIEFLRSHDWASTALGPMSEWPTRLRNLVYSTMSNPDPRFMIWGDQRAFIYNEACVPLIGRRHPDSLGNPFRDHNQDIWPELGPLVNDAYAGKAAKLEELPLAMDRIGFVEETYWDVTLLPLLGFSGHGVGALCELKECSSLVTGERRRSAIMNVSEKVARVNLLNDLWPVYLKALEPFDEDVRFAILYATEEEMLGPAQVPSDYASDSVDITSPNAFRTKCVLQGTIGIPGENFHGLDSFSLGAEADIQPPLINSYLEACRSRKSLMFKTADGSLPGWMAKGAPHRGFGDDVKSAVVHPIVSITADHEILGLLIVGLSPRSRFNEEYHLFINFLVEILQKGAATISLPQEQRRAQKIADDINNALAQQLRMTTLAAERSEAKLSRLAASAPVGMYVVHADGRPMYVNDAYLRMTGETREGFFTRSCDPDFWKESLHSDDHKRFISEWEQMVADKSPLTIQYRLRKPWNSIDKASGKGIEGQTWVVATAYPEVDSDGNIISIQGWLTDISHQKFSEKLLAQKLDDAIENKRQTENFIDMTSHEMRNPLSAILQSADAIVQTLQPDALRTDPEDEIVMTTEAGDEIMDSAQTIILCAQHQKRIVDDILTLSKLDASLLVISPDKVQPPTLITKALKMYEAELQRAQIDASLHVEDSYSELGIEWVILDASRLLQVVINLLTNAIKFTQYAENRKITIFLGASKEQPTGKHHNIQFIPHTPARPSKNPLDEWDSYEDVYIQIAVTDTGAGLSPSDMKVLFQRFSQASPKTYSQYGGSGLGLWIAKNLSELQGGQIGVRSGNGETTFTFYVRAKEYTPDNSDELSQQLSRRPSAQRFVSASNSPMVFSRRGSTVINEQNKNPLVLSRISSRLGKLDDGQTVREDNRPKLWSKKQAQTPSSRASSKGAPSRSSTWPTPSPSTKGPLHVLVVEDNMVNQRVMSQQLRKAGCVVHVANHGIECLDFLEKSAFCLLATAKLTPTPLSIILLDLEMPTMDGLTCIREIRKRQQGGSILRHVPVIAITANARHEQITVAIDAGMDEVVTKPIRVFEIIPQMERLVGEIAETYLVPVDADGHRNGEADRNVKADPPKK